MRSSRLGRLRDLAVVGLAVALPLAVAGCTAAAAPSTVGPSGARPSTSSTIRFARCTVDQLAPSVDSSRSGQQTIEPAVVLTNQSTRACTVQGTPTVAFAEHAGGQRIGPEALREPSQPSPELTLQPGDAAEADLIVDFPDRTATPCRQHDAEGFSVVLPGARRAIFVDYPYPACENKRLLAVFPLQQR